MEKSDAGSLAIVGDSSKVEGECWRAERSHPNEEARPVWGAPCWTYEIGKITFPCAPRGGRWSDGSAERRERLYTYSASDREVVWELGRGRRIDDPQPEGTAIRMRSCNVDL